jgi:Protein of unknown function (DUF1214)
VPGAVASSWARASFATGDARTPGLRRDADGLLTIVIQHEQPADTSNWLPAPAAPFRPIMCLYQPEPAVLDGPIRSRPSPRWRPRPAGRRRESTGAAGTVATAGQVHDILACPVNGPAATGIGPPTVAFQAGHFYVGMQGACVSGCRQPLMLAIDCRRCCHCCSQLQPE